MRLVWVLMVGFTALFLLNAQLYRFDALMVDYGRADAQSWLLWRARTLDESVARADGGPVAWLIGNSVMRDSFDEDALNTSLAEQGSRWRAVKLASSRGAAGLAVGLLDHIPLREGDLVFHAVTLDHFRQDWLSVVDLPADRLARMRTPAEIVAIEELSWQSRLEHAVGVPHHFYRHHEPYMAGLEAWFVALWWLEPPRKARPGMHLRYRSTASVADVSARRAALVGRDPIDAAQLDWRPSQFNHAGIAAMRQRVDAAGATLVLVDIPYRRVYREQLVTDAAWAEWRVWRDAQPDLEGFPQLDEAQFYDMRHPNTEGRARLTAHLADRFAQRR